MIDSKDSMTHGKSFNESKPRCWATTLRMHILYSMSFISKNRPHVIALNLVTCNHETYI